MIAAVIGAGVTGLSAAFYLKRAGVKTIVFEAEDRAGGNIRTRLRDGFVVDTGPDSWVTQKPEATRLVSELGLDSELIAPLPTARRVYVVHQRQLAALPDGLTLGIPTQWRSLLSTPLFSWVGKARMGVEWFIPPRDSDQDESVGAFLRRRLGDEATDVVAGPLLGGIYSGEVDDLSLAATFPQLRESERKFGSLIRSMLERKRLAARSPQSVLSGTFVSMRRGLSQFMDALAAAADDLRLGASVEKVERRGQRYAITTRHGETLADVVLFAGRTQAPAKLLRELAPEASVRMGAIEYRSTATVFFGCDDGAFERALDGSGFIVPKREPFQIRAGTWVSSKWPGRAPAGKTLVRVFFGGQEATDGSDSELIDVATRELGTLMGFVPEKALFSDVFRLRERSPQPTMGHLDRVSAIRAALARELPGVYVAGQAYDGGSIPDCVRQAKREADAIARLSARN